MFQVGVSLMLQSRRQESIPTEGNKDSGYQTNNVSVKRKYLKKQIYYWLILKLQLG